MIMKLNAFHCGFVIWSALTSSLLAVPGNKFRRVCYFSSWAIYRPGTGKFSPSDIDPFLCTHIIYAFAKLEEDTFALDAFDSWADLDRDYGLGGYNKLLALRQLNNELKIMLSVGGWNAGSSTFSNMVAIRMRRKTFIDSAMRYLRKHQFDGLDINWEFPGVRGGRANDRDNFDLFLQEFRVALNSEVMAYPENAPLLLSAAVSASPQTIAISYNVSSLPRHLDFVSIMTYDFHGSWDTQALHHSPIYGRSDDQSSSSSVGLDMMSAVRLWLDGGCPPDKIVVGIPLYGRSFTLADTHHTTPGSKIVSGGELGPFTREPGFLAYFEVCSLLMDSTWTVITDSDERVPYAYKEDQWIGFDDVDSVIRKAVIAREWGLGGVMVWSVDMDDFRGLCTSQNYPLLRMIKKVLEFQPVRAVNPLPAPPATTFVVSNPSQNEPAMPPRLLLNSPTQPAHHLPQLLNPANTASISLQVTVPPIDDQNLISSASASVPQYHPLRGTLMVPIRSDGLVVVPALANSPQRVFSLHEQYPDQTSSSASSSMTRPVAASFLSQIVSSHQLTAAPSAAADVNRWLLQQQQQQQKQRQRQIDLAILSKLNSLRPSLNNPLESHNIRSGSQSGSTGLNDLVPSDSNIGEVTFPQPHILPPMDCPFEGFYRNPRDCTRFYRCIQAEGRWTAYHFMCPAGLVFDPNYNVCNWRSLSPACGG